jgi:hypothetical protein
MSDTQLCGCAECRASRSKPTMIPAPRCLAHAIRQQRSETAKDRMLRVVKTLAPTPVSDATLLRVVQAKGATQ